MSRLIGGNTTPGTNWAARLEACLSGSYGFERFDSWPSFVCAPEWPSSRLIQANVNESPVFIGASWGNRLAFRRGVASWKRITGITKDSAGSPLAAATVRLFQTSDNAFLMQTTSAPDGTYEVGVKDSTTQCYLVAYKAGSPDITGATVNILTGA